MTEVFSCPDLPEANRIWDCLDYVFEVPQNLAQEQKGQWILTEIRDRYALFASSRKVRAPPGLVNRLVQQTPTDSSGSQDLSASRREVQGFDSSQVDPTRPDAAREVVHQQYVALHNGQGVFHSNYYPTKGATQTVSLGDDRIGDIDWVCPPGDMIRATILAHVCPA